MNAMKKKKNGFIALTSLLVISAVTLMIAMSVTFMGISSMNSSLGYQKGQEALKIGESCLEETLFRLRDDGNFSGITLTVGNGICTATATAISNPRIITIYGTLSGLPEYKKGLEITATRVGKSITIDTWKEIY